MALTPVYLFFTFPWRKASSSPFPLLLLSRSSGRFGHPWFWDFVGNTTVEKSCTELADETSVDCWLTSAERRTLKKPQWSSFRPGITYWRQKFQSNSWHSPFHVEVRHKTFNHATRDKYMARTSVVEDFWPLPRPLENWSCICTLVQYGGLSVCLSCHGNAPSPLPPPPPRKNERQQRNPNYEKSRNCIKFY